MSFDSIWSNLTKSKPDLLDSSSKIVISSKEFKNLLKQVYDKGIRDAMKETESTKYVDYFFSSIFKKK